LTVTIPNPVSPFARRIEVQAAPMRLIETEGGLALSVELPGLEQADVEVAVCEGVLSVSGGAAVLTDALRRLDAAQIVLDDVGLRRPTLDDVFLSLTGHAAEQADEPPTDLPAKQSS